MVGPTKRNPRRFRSLLMSSASGVSAGTSERDAHRFTIVDRKSTRLNSSHLVISYAVFCLKKKKKKTQHDTTSRTPPTRSVLSPPVLSNRLPPIRVGPQHDPTLAFDQSVRRRTEPPRPPRW